MEKKRARRDARIAAVAARQHGVISVKQLREAGVRDTAIHKRVRSGRLHRLHRGVYAVGHPNVGVQGRWMAAVLAFGEAAVLSHRSAAALWGLLPPLAGPVDVTLPSRGGRRRRARIRLHRSSTLAATDRARHKGIPVTTPRRTIRDLRRVVTGAELRRAVRQAEVLGFGVEDGLGGDRTRSELEYRFLQLCRRHRLPQPEVNVRIGPYTVDFLWRKQRLVVETDGFRYHRGMTAFADDCARDLELRALGYEVVRLAYRQVTEEGERVVTALSNELRARGS
jgi:very-short-patch-repair endonuclease